MIHLLYILYTAAAAAATLGVGAAVAGHRLRCRRRQHDRRLRSASIRRIVAAQLTDAEADIRLPLQQAVGRRTLLCELLSELSAATCGLDAAPVRRLAERYGLERWLLGRIRRSRGCRRARYLKWLADLPVSEAACEAAGHYLNDRCREVRFCALLVRIAAAREGVLDEMARFDPPLTDGEVSEVLHLLGRGMLPIAYRPLLEAENGNLRRLGLAIVGRFGVEDAEALLLRIVAAEAEPLATEALHVLIGLHRPMRRREVTGRVQRMSAAERHALLRRLAREAYAPHSVRHLIAPDEEPYYESLVQSYKRQLAWQ